MTTTTNEPLYTAGTIVQRTSAGTQSVSLYADQLSKRRIFLSGTVTDEMASLFAIQVTELNDLSDEPIHVFLDSVGGSVDAGMVMYDIIRTSPAPVIMYCTGKAYSMGALLLAAGQHGRYLLPHARMMIHQPLVERGLGGNLTSVQEMAASLQDCAAMINEVFADVTGKSVSRIEEDTARDNYFTAREAVAYGLADQIMSYGEMFAASGCL